MKTIITNVALIIIAYVVQFCLFPFIPFLSTSPNLMLLLVFSYGFIYGSKKGMLYGMFAGLLLDLFYSGPMGIYTLVYMWLGYINGMASTYFYEDYVTMPMLLCIVNELVYNLYIYITRYLIRGKTNLLYYLMHIVAPEIIFTLLTTLLFYRLYLMYNKKIDNLDKKRGKESA